MSGRGVSRRELLLGTGWLVGGVTVLGGCGWLPVLPTFADSDLSDALSWVQMRADGRVRFHCPRAEMGQDASTGLAQVVAEELWLAPSTVLCRRPRSDEIAPTRMTVGSQSIELFFEPGRRRRPRCARRCALVRRSARPSIRPDSSCARAASCGRTDAPSTTRS